VTTVDVEALEAKVKQMYRLLAEQPNGNYHFEMGRSLAERLGSDRSCCTGSRPRVLRGRRVRLRGSHGSLAGCMSKKDG
jgi:hypothetical protein